MPRVAKHAHVADELPGSQHRDAALLAGARRHDLDGAAQHDERRECLVARAEQAMAPRQVEVARIRHELVELFRGEPLESRQAGQDRGGIERRFGKARHPLERIARRRRPGGTVLVRGRGEQAGVHRRELAREDRGDRVLQADRGRLALRDDGAEVLVGDEPALDAGCGADGRGARAQLEQRHLAEDVARAELRHGEALAARQRDHCLHRAFAQHEGATRRVAVAHQLGAAIEMHRAGDREQLGARLGVEAIEEGWSVGHATRYSTDLSSLPISAGLRVTLMPHASITEIFSCAVPLPPEMMAPAWPMRLPGGAVTPAMKPTTGFFMLSFAQLRGGLLVAAADLADHDHRVGVGIVVEHLQHVDVLESVHRVAADAHRATTGRGRAR